MTVGDLTERELIARIQQRLAPAPAWMIVGIGDDAAVVQPERNQVDALTVDAIVDGIHFDRAFVPPEAIGHRALAVNLSDLAAMGAAPRVALLSMALPACVPLQEFDGIIDGLAALAVRHHVHVAGGNLTRTPGPLTLDVTALGALKRRQTLTRAGACPGDEVYVSGAIGAAAAGLARLRAVDPHRLTPDDRHLTAAYLWPEPRVRLGTLLGRNRAATSCVDLSDGLADGVHQIAQASGVGLRIEADALPIDEAARGILAADGADPVAAAVAGGDDYELLFTVRPRTRGRLRAAIRHAGTPLTRIGVCTDDRQVVLVRTTGTEPMPSGYTHFR